jgi:hypothetical protein
MPLNATQASTSDRQQANSPSNEAAARLLISLYFQDIVNNGRANKYLNDGGQTEIHLMSGEVFLLAESVITRLV